MIPTHLGESPITLSEHRLFAVPWDMMKTASPILPFSWQLFSSVDVPHEFPVDYIVPSSQSVRSRSILILFGKT